MKICYLANIGTTHMPKLVRCFAEKGHEVHVISMEKPNIPIDGVNLHLIDTNRKFLYFTFLYKIFQMSRIINSIKPDIIHAHYITKYGILGALLGYKPLIMSAWGSDILIDTKGIFLYPIKYALSKAMVVHCDGENVRDELVKLGVDADRIRLIYFGTDPGRFNPDKKREQLKEELGIAGHPMIICTRNFYPSYDVQTLIRSVPLVLKSIPDAEFVFFGRGPGDELKELASSLGVASNVHFLGYVPNDELPVYLASSDIFVSPSLSDGGIAVSITDAMACGLPVIVTDVADNSKLIKDNVNGFVIPVKSPEVLAEKIIYLIRNDNLRAKFGNLNRSIIVNEYNYFKEMKKIENIYKESLI
ncbi:putative glycosyltransferase [Methanocella paludicola SANAE]|uniref:Glycosyltransferase n=1 Tax=Methanocella paludicola (strain DSM 17711 / JCM 13418 / NBRC 101707 / SANAE) TaxID=304371 RepID=D1YWM1_METPS|nr:glycosyltransferase family 4 protein [Methanocella paludicola]BAI60843.1 putative glycosyltransferase [Methanocella paludicola SANAE]